MNAIVILLFSIFLNIQPVLVERAFYVMGTIIEFKLYCEDRELCKKAISDAHSEVKRLDDMLSNYKADSKLTEVNSLAGTGKTRVPQEFFELTGRSLFFSNLTGGVFDVTIGKLLELWRKAQQENTLPGAKTLGKTVSECIGFRRIQLYPEKSEIEIKSPCLSIDFGGIGKGYAIDRAVKILKSKGIKSGIVNFGGEIYAIGAPPGKKGWLVGVKNPIKQEDVLTFIEVNDIAVSTSGDYERYFEIGGRRFSHIIDPRTGLPVDSVPSVTVIAENATDADALSTAISVMGKDKSIEVLKGLDRVGVMIVTEEKNKHTIYKNASFQGFEVAE
ncbi:MAG: FAD:protein FMN transferase [Deltaproteobacteria bacterium]|nr:FAD:protein FMN transferase [Deltaproteobacteria bacterium]